MSVEGRYNRDTYAKRCEEVRVQQNLDLELGFCGVNLGYALLVCLLQDQEGIPVNQDAFPLCLE